MNFETVEFFVKGKRHDQSDCEDIAVDTHHFGAVIDGATAKYPLTLEGRSPGRVIANVVAKSVQLLDPEIDFESCLKFINGRVRSDCTLMRMSDLKQDKKDLPTAAVVILSKLRQEIWVLGEGLVRLDGKNRKFSKKIDAVNAAFRSLINQISIINGQSVSELLENDLGRNAIIESLRAQALFQNNPSSGEFAYGAIDGSDDAIGFGETIDASEARNITIATDGYPTLRDTLEESESELTRLIHEDPLMIFGHKDTKGIQKSYSSYDDRAYIQFRNNS